MPQRIPSLNYQPARPKRPWWKILIALLVAGLYLAEMYGHPLWKLFRGEKTLKETGFATGIITVSVVGMLAAAYWARKRL